jgi:large subunit ribosomal protein L9
MKVLLTEDVEKLGLAGDIVTVADGYARNYLIPQELAVKAHKGLVRQAEVIRRQARRKRERIVAEMEALTAKLNGLQLTFEANAGEKGRLYGSVTRDDVIEAAEAKIGEEVDRRKLDMEPLRQLGVHTVPVRLSADLVPELVVIVHREGEDPATYLAAAEAEAQAAAEAQAEAEAQPEVEADESAPEEAWTAPAAEAAEADESDESDEGDEGDPEL